MALRCRERAPSTTSKPVGGEANRRGYSTEPLKQWLNRRTVGQIFYPKWCSVTFPEARFLERIGDSGVGCRLDRGLRRYRRGRHVDLAVYARMWSRGLSGCSSGDDGARRAATPAPVATSHMAGPERRAAPGRPHFFAYGAMAYASLIAPSALRFSGRGAAAALGDCPFAPIIVS